MAAALDLVHLDPLRAAVRGGEVTAELDRLQKTLDHRFRDQGLLQAALTHRSAARDGIPSNERLEFLGDRVLGLVVSDMLYRAYPDEPEGALARRFASLVRRETLADVAVALDLAPHIRAAPAENAEARDNPAILANACEAIIAAIYLDAGIEAARGFLERHWQPLMAADPTPPKDAKTSLQERMQGAGHPLPDYDIVERSGPPHSPHFVVEVRVAGAPPQRGEGRSRRIAEQAAAQAMLTSLGHVE
ncbi:MAG: ribonuclease III [Dongiaceae bacterium]